MIASFHESYVGYDPYNSADRMHVKAAQVTKTADAVIDAQIRRGFKYLENHPQIAAEVFSRSLAIGRGMKNPLI